MGDGLHCRSHVVLDGILRMAAGDISPNHSQQVFERSGHRDAIHRYIRSFITRHSQSGLRTTEGFGLGEDHRLDHTAGISQSYSVPKI